MKKKIKVDRGLNRRSLSHWSCALSIELRLLAGFRAEIMNICFMIVIVIDISLTGKSITIIKIDIIIDIIIVRTTQEAIMTLILSLTLTLS